MGPWRVERAGHRLTGARPFDVSACALPLAEHAVNTTPGVLEGRRHSLSVAPRAVFVSTFFSRQLTGDRAKGWCLLVHEEACLSHGGQGESLVPPYTRGSVSLCL